MGKEIRLSFKASPICLPVGCLYHVRGVIIKSFNHPSPFEVKGAEGRQLQTQVRVRRRAIARGRPRRIIEAHHHHQHHHHGDDGMELRCWVELSDGDRRQRRSLRACSHAVWSICGYRTGPRRQCSIFGSRNRRCKNNQIELIVRSDRIRERVRHGSLTSRQAAAAVMGFPGR